MAQSTTSMCVLLLIANIASAMLLVSVDAATFHVQRQHMTIQRMDLASGSSNLMDSILSIRAGASDDDEYDDDEYDNEYDSDDEEEESRLSASAVKAMKKAQSKKKKEVKSKVSKSLSSGNVAKKKKASLTSKIPYVIRAFMNPFTVIAMTRGYFASLFNIDYLKKEASETLRSALQEKAKSAPSTGRKRARKMKPGQAKTLSDLPVLNA